MFNDNNINNPVPVNDASKEANKELIIKENFSKELVKNLKSENADIILPDEIKVTKSKKKE
ncbi:hypothetical protein P7H75_10615 [Vagococcus carniphilus]|uniref:hypothetical protein n=1 Tax=Vagococcus carniphilus TaxID=218144 RepID=UPI00288F9E72|nr:hypothetical protein [Vagococcus carniphilus]MDT2815304.1 hypothetical protein [Vagococcus carniphilus]